jgi:hypothetical protein
VLMLKVASQSSSAVSSAALFLLMPVGGNTQAHSMSQLIYADMVTKYGQRFDWQPAKKSSGHRELHALQ